MTESNMPGKVDTKSKKITKGEKDPALAPIPKSKSYLNLIDLIIEQPVPVTQNQ